jgi:dipeptidyl aminopeptidase/acylaminoacyl peptidase
MMLTSVRQILALLLLAFAVPPSDAQDKPQNANTLAKKPVTVADSIRMSLVNDIASEQLGRNPAVVSPDGKLFVVVIRRGNIERNTNDYSLLLFHECELWTSARAETLATFSSGSNRPGIERVRWLDNQRIAFLGENLDSVEQLYVLSIKNKQLKKITHHPNPLAAFSLSSDGQTIAFLAHPPIESLFDEKSRKYGLVISSQQLSDVMIGSTSDKENGFLYPFQLFVQHKGGAAGRINLNENRPMAVFGVSLSPDGRYAVLEVTVENVPVSWKIYKHRGIPVVKDDDYVLEYLLVDCLSGASRPLIDAPTDNWQPAIVWSSDSKRVLIANTFLPVDVPDEKEKRLREGEPFLAVVDIDTGKVQKLGHDEFDLAQAEVNKPIVRLRRKPKDPEESQGFVFYRENGDAWSVLSRENVSAEMPFEIREEEGMNTPPRLFVRNTSTGQEKLILDLNPQFAHLDFGEVKEFSWNTSDGHSVSGGLYFPPDYSPGKKYPLVIQTHRWDSTKFWIDGFSTAGYAAQALACKGFLVAQIPDPKFTDDIHEGPAQVAMYEGLIDALDHLGLIDRESVGLLGFSRTGYGVKYMLAFSKYPIKAAIVADGLDGGYLQYMYWLNMDTAFYRSYEDLNGGMPFGDGLQKWVRGAPSFNLDKVKTPLRVLGFRPYSLLQEWEWFAGLKRLGSPVELVWLKDAEHTPIKPSERMTAQQGAVDWFCFWMQGIEDADPAKVDQYRRWRQLRSRAEHAAATEH